MRGPPTPANATTNPTTSIPTTAAVVERAVAVPIATSTSATGHAPRKVRVRWAGGPLTSESTPNEMTPNTA